MVGGRTRQRGHIVGGRTRQRGHMVGGRTRQRGLKIGGRTKLRQRQKSAQRPWGRGCGSFRVPEVIAACLGVQKTHLRDKWTSKYAMITALISCPFWPKGKVDILIWSIEGEMVQLRAF